MPFYTLSEMKLKQKREGVFAKVMTGQLMQMTLIHLDCGVSTDHSHENEQMGYILSGEVEITISNEKKICKFGDAYLIPSNIQHGFKVLSKKGVDYLEMFSPPKEENSKWYENGMQKISE